MFCFALILKMVSHSGGKSPPSKRKFVFCVCCTHKFIFSWDSLVHHTSLQHRGNKMFWKQLLLWGITSLVWWFCSEYFDHFYLTVVSQLYQLHRTVVGNIPPDLPGVGVLITKHYSGTNICPWSNTKLQLLTSNCFWICNQTLRFHSSLKWMRVLWIETWICQPKHTVFQWSWSGEQQIEHLRSSLTLRSKWPMFGLCRHIILIYFKWF